MPHSEGASAQAQGVKEHVGAPSGMRSGRPHRESPDGTTHTLSASSFAQLAQGSGGSQAVAELRAGQRSRIMLLLRAFVDLASGHPGLPGPLSSFDEVWRLLLDAERRSPASVEKLLAHPPVRTWLSHCLRRVRGRRHGASPLWVEAGYLHAVAASAALLAGIGFRITVPVRDGGLMLPGLGYLSLAGGEAAAAEIVREGNGRAADVIAAGCTARLPLRLTQDTADWQSLRTLSGNSSGHSCSPVLDDLDPYRDFLRPTPPRRLGPESLRSWREHFALAWPLIAGQKNIDPGGVAQCVLSVVPVYYAAHPDPFSGSSSEAFGCVLLNPPRSAETLAASLLHEAQHIKLSALMDLVSLLHGGLEEVHYAPWRTDPRPLRGVLQGVYAFLGVTGFWQDRLRNAPDERAAQAAAFEFALRRTQTAAGLRTLREHARMTAAGEAFLNGVENRLTPWLAEPVAEAPGRLAADVVTDHRLVYRMRHLLPGSEALRGWARAWRLRQSPPEELPRSTLRVARAGISSRMALARSRVAGRPGPAGRRPPPESVQGAVLPCEADLAWVGGELGEAEDGYLRRLRVDAEDINAWAGLALVLPAGPARDALRRRPEVVLGLHRSLRLSGPPGPDPLALADFVGARC